MTDQSNTDAPQPPEPLFTIDLGANGGVFAPTTVQEMEAWARKERDFWSWVSSVQTGSHRNALDQLFNPLFPILQNAEAARAAAHEGARSERIAAVLQGIRNAYVDRKTPHSSTPFAKRTEAIRQQSPTAAIGYLFAVLPAAEAYNNRFDGHDLGSWWGFLEGLRERFGEDFQGGPLKGQRDALEELRTRLEQLHGAKSATYAELERRFNALATSIDAAAQKQEGTFAQFMEDSKKEHKGALDNHEEQMKTLQATFREKMALRSSVDYWTKRGELHKDRAENLLKATFLSIAGLAVAVVAAAYWVFKTSTDPSKPDAWKLVALGLLGVLGVWAVRLVVRMFLSDRHLSIDAEERVTMVQTYLALMEDQKVPTDEDRKLILQPLFRPASDGIVKDEGLPHPALEWLTRSGR